MANIAVTYLFRIKCRAFRQLAEHRARGGNLAGSSPEKIVTVEEHIELISRQNNLIEQIRAYREENETLLTELELKEKVLRDSN